MKKNISILIALLAMGTAAFAQKAPKLTSPDNNATVTPSELTRPEAFIWDPNIAVGGQVTYRLSIWEGEKGDSKYAPGIYIVRKPIIVHDYKNVKSASLTDVSLLQPGHDYVCGIQALNDNGKGIGDNEGRGDVIFIHIAPAKSESKKK